MVIDITITPIPLAGTDTAQQKFENVRAHMLKKLLKWKGKTRDGKLGHAMIMDLVDQRIALIPATVSPFGELGPMFRYFLRGSGQFFLPYDDEFFNKSNRRDTAAISVAKTMASFAHSEHLDGGVLSHASTSWHEERGAAWYGDTYCNGTPGA